MAYIAKTVGSYGQLQYIGDDYTASIMGLASVQAPIVRTPTVGRFWLLNSVRLVNPNSTWMSVEFQIVDSGGAARGALPPLGSPRSLVVASPGDVIAWQGKQLIPASWGLAVSIPSNPGVSTTGAGAATVSFSYSAVEFLSSAWEQNQLNPPSFTL